MKGSENREKIEENWPDLAHRAKLLRYCIRFIVWCVSSPIGKKFPGDGLPATETIVSCVAHEDRAKAAE